VLPGLSVREALRTSAFYKLMIAATFFTFTLSASPSISFRSWSMAAYDDGGGEFAGIGGLCAILGGWAPVSSSIASRRRACRAAMVLPISGCALLLVHGGWGCRRGRRC